MNRQVNGVLECYERKNWGLNITLSTLLIFTKDMDVKRSTAITNVHC